MSVTEIPFTQMTEAEWQTRLGLAACYRPARRPCDRGMPVKTQTATGLRQSPQE